MKIDPGSGAARLHRKNESRIPRWLRPILEVPLEVKVLWANLIIVGVALLLLFGPVKLQPSRLTDAYIVVAVLMLGAVMNFGLVRLALRPLKSIERVAKWVSQGVLGGRVPTSVVADHELARLSRTINELLDSRTADRKRIEKLGARVSYREEEERSQASDRAVRLRDDNAAAVPTSATEVPATSPCATDTVPGTTARHRSLRLA
jgi:HAMP domain-containing protein